jgi:hypothetical protein
MPAELASREERSMVLQSDAQRFLGSSRDLDPLPHCRNK